MYGMVDRDLHYLRVQWEEVSWTSDSPKPLYNDRFSLALHVVAVPSVHYVPCSPSWFSIISNLASVPASLSNLLDLPSESPECVTVEAVDALYW